MAQSIQIDIKGNAGSLLKALKQSETAMSKLAQSTNRLSGIRVRGAATADANTKAVTQNTDAQNRNAAATRTNAAAQGTLDKSLAGTTARLGQANAGFYNIAFAIEDAGQFANGFSFGMRAIGNNLSAIALSLTAAGASFKDFGNFLRGPGGLIIGISAFTAAAQLVPVALEKMGIGIDEAGEKLATFREGLEEAASSFINLKTDLAEGFEFTEDQIRAAQGIIEQRNEELKLQAISNGLSREQVDNIDEAIDSLEGQIFRRGLDAKLGIEESERLKEQAEERLAIAQSLQRSLSVNQSISAEFDEQLSALETNKIIQEGLAGLGGKRVVNEEQVVEALEGQVALIKEFRGLAMMAIGARQIRRQILPEGGLRTTPDFDLGFDPDEDAKRMESQMGQLQSSTQAGMAGFTSAILSGEQSVGSAFGSFFAMMGDQLIRLGIANIGLGTAGEALRAFVTNPAVAIAAGAALLAIGSQLRKKTRMAQANILSGSGGGISSGYSLNRNQFATSSSASVGYIAPPPPPRNPYAEIRMDAKDFVVSLDDARRELDVVT